MAAKMSWYFGSKVVLCALSGRVTPDDLKQIDNQAAQYLNQGKAPVHVFVDVRKLEKFPRNLFQVKTILQTLRSRPLGWEVLIGRQTLLVRFVAWLVAQASGTHLQMVDTLEQAVAFLSRIDPELAVPNDEWSDINNSGSVFFRFPH